jgi:hypothetical protein
VEEPSLWARVKIGVNTSNETQTILRNPTTGDCAGLMPLANRWHRVRLIRVPARTTSYRAGLDHRDGHL